MATPAKKAAMSVICFPVSAVKCYIESEKQVFRDVEHNDTRA